MKKKMKSLIAIAAALMMLLGAVPAFAAMNPGTENYTPVNGDNSTCTFNKYFLMSQSANVPAITFNYTIAAASGIDDGLHMEILAGKVVTDGTGAVTAPTVGTAAFTANDSTNISAQGTDNITVGSGEKYAKKSVTVDFSGVSFDEPGIYRYIITEQEVSGRSDISYDTQKTGTAQSKQRILDVYVKDNNGDLEVAQYVLRDAAATSTIDTNGTMGSDNSTTTTYQEVTNFASFTGTKYYLDTSGNYVTDASASTDNKVYEQVTTPAALADKSDGYVNEYKSQNLEFGKEVTGNQGSKDKYFKFTLKIQNASPNTEYTVDLTNASATSGSSSATITANQNKANTDKITTNASGEAKTDFYLKDGQYITVKGLPEGARYQVLEASEDYASTDGIQATEGKGGVAYTDPTGGTIGKKVVQDDNGTLKSDGTAYTTEELDTAAVADRYKLADDQSVKTGYTNSRDGVIPTGVMVAVLPGVLIAAVGVFGFLMLRRKKRRYA